MNKKAKVIIRFAIGAYLLYTDYMIRGVFSETMTMDAILRIVAFVIFAIVGIGLIIWSVRDMKNGALSETGASEVETISDNIVSSESDELNN